MIRLPMIDISEDQPVVDFTLVKAAGVVAVYAKATEGHTLQDSCFKSHHDAAKAANLPFGAYHFWHFNSSTASEQAENFLTQIDGYAGSLLPMVDVEKDGQDGMTDSVEMIKRLSTFISLVEKSLNGKKMLIYCGWSFWNDVLRGSDAFSGHPSWVAAYEDSSNLVPLAAGFSSTTIWQYTDHFIVDGIPKPVDGDLLLVPLEQISR